jgi:hypothetical protein
VRSLFLLPHPRIEAEEAFVVEKDLNRRQKHDEVSDDGLGTDFLLK